MTQPNLIFIMPDQLRPDFLGCYGADFVETPHIDSLAARGTRYDRCYSTSPICVPARASLLTGLDSLATGVTDNGQWLRPDLGSMGIHTWPELLAAQGYYTAAIGKMHFYPWDLRHGFQYRVIAEDKRWIHIRDDYYHFLRGHNERKYHGNEHEGYFDNRGAIINRLPWELSVDHFVGQEACHFVRTYGKDKPFAMMIGFPGPHCPYDPNAEFLAQVDMETMPDPIPEVPDNAPQLRQRNIQGNLGAWNGVDYTEFTAAHKRKIRAHYAASVMQIDYEIGQLLNALRETDQLDNTIIIFASDHGDYLGDHNLIGKGTFHESSIHVPLIVHRPGDTAARSNTQLVTLTDVTATLLSLGGAELPSYLDSTPLPDLELADSQTREVLIGATSSGQMIYDGSWKLGKYDTGEILLFNLDDDPQEQRNLAADPAHQQTYLDLDSRLTQAVMRARVRSHVDKRVYSQVSLSGDPGFGSEGWQRRYPQWVEGIL